MRPARHGQSQAAVCRLHRLPHRANFTCRVEEPSTASRADFQPGMNASAPNSSKVQVPPCGDRVVETGTSRLRDLFFRNEK
jgi:hypothetical protein